mmetsp:Transcript_2541/g.7455  ORF Transcript_2541/g.7455 Transcript_2541/m.7455 type:complete len:291 (+) Transcript_2541:42-914(+)
MSDPCHNYVQLFYPRLFGLWFTSSCRHFLFVPRQGRQLPDCVASQIGIHVAPLRFLLLQNIQTLQFHGILQQIPSLLELLLLRTDPKECLGRLCRTKLTSTLDDLLDQCLASLSLLQNDLPILLHGLDAIADVNVQNIVGNAGDGIQIDAHLGSVSAGILQGLATGCLHIWRQRGQRRRDPNGRIIPQITANLHSGQRATRRKELMRLHLFERNALGFKVKCGGHINRRGRGGTDVAFVLYRRRLAIICIFLDFAFGSGAGHINGFAFRGCLGVIVIGCRWRGLLLGRRC